MIDYIDNFLDDMEYSSVLFRCIKSPFYYGETDNANTPPTGMSCSISNTDDTFKLFNEKIRQKIKYVENLEIYRMYINCFAPGEVPYYHIDNTSGITCLYYPNPQMSLDEGGETQFFVDNKSINILPVPNRLCFFDANIIHRATSFRTHHRFTIAIKYH